MAHDLYKTVVVFDKDLPKEEFYKIEKELAIKIVQGCDPTQRPILTYLHQAKGFGNTKVTKGEQTWYGWCTYFYYTTEKDRADEIFRLLQRMKFVTTFETVILKGKAAAKIDTSTRVNVNDLTRTYLKKKKELDMFDMIFDF